MADIPADLLAALIAIARRGASTEQDADVIDMAEQIATREKP